jgi:phosphomethylpyrimidine synthase
MAAKAGADFLCYVTPAEHLCLPAAADVRQGVIATRIAAHVADVAKCSKTAQEWDARMGKARKDLNWQTQAELAIDPELAMEIREKSPPAEADACTMCGEFCAMKGIKEYFSVSND